MIDNIRIFDLSSFEDHYGCLVPLEATKDIPFDIKRVYYIYDVGEEIRRGFHSHRDLEQVLICVHGSVIIHTKTPYHSEDIKLDSPKKALYLGPMVWREMYSFSSGATLLVLASEHYTQSDYIRDYQQYEVEAKEYFKR